MGNDKHDAGAQFEQLARQYWDAWSQFAPAPASGPAVPGWKEGLDWWSRIAGQGNDGVEATLARMNAQAGHWFGAMQQLAAGFAGREAAPKDISAAWRSLLEGSGANPLAQMFRQMAGADAQGIEAWYAQVAPFLGGLRGEAASWLHLPAFGLAREHQERLQRLAQAHLDYQQCQADYQALLAGIGQRALQRFEDRLAERAEPGRQIESARALFDLWIDAAEEAWAETAMSPQYRSVYGALVNAQMRLRGGVQREVEQIAGLFGLPTRTEVDASHRKVAALEREVRALRAKLEADMPATVQVPPAPVDQAFDDDRSGAGSVAKPARRASAARKRAAAKPAAVKPEPATPTAPPPAKKAAPRTQARRAASAGAKKSQPRAAAKGTLRKALLPQVTAPRAVRASAGKPAARRGKAR